MRSEVQQVLQSPTESQSTTQSPPSIEESVRAFYKAYEEKDLTTAQNLVAEQFSFTSPLDNRLGREAYFKICWPNSKSIEKFEFKHFTVENEKAFVVYECQSKSNKFRNTEILTVQNGKVTKVEVYFGWDVPHKIPEGEHRDPSQEPQAHPITGL